MGAYENPKFIEAPNYLAGTQAFLKTFQKGLDEGVAYGEELIADREEYEKGVYEAGDELKTELDAALGNTGDAKKKIQDSLDAFYADALKVDAPTKKGLAGIFSKPTEKRLGTHDLKKTQENFTNEVQGINTAFNYVYDPEIDIKENEDRGADNYDEKLAIHNAIKNNFEGGGGTDFSYKDGKFKGSISVKINGEIKEYSTARIQAIFTSSGKEQRDIIDANHTEMQEGVFKAASAEVNNIIKKLKEGNDRGYADASEEVKKIVRRRLGIGEEGKTMSQVDEKFINDEYNNHADISLENKVTKLSEQLLGPNGENDFGLDPKSETFEKEFNTILESIADDTYNSGSKIYADRFGIKDPAKANDLYNRIKEGKKEIVYESYIQDLEAKGLMDDYNREVAVKTGDSGNGGDTGPSDEDLYFRQKVNEASSTIDAFVANEELKSVFLSRMGPPNEDGSTGAPLSGLDEIEIKNGVIVGDQAKKQIDQKIQDNLTAYGNTFLNKKFSFRGSTESASGLVFGKGGDITLKFDGKTVMKDVFDEDNKKIGEKSVTLKESTLKFNVYDPERMRTYYNAISTEKGSVGKNAMRGYSVEFDKNMVNKYGATVDGLTKLNQPGMGKWIDFVASGNGGQVQGAKENIFKYIKFLEEEKALGKEMKRFKNANIKEYNKYHGIVDTSNANLPIF